MAGRLLATSDLHGCCVHFLKMLHKVKLTKEDTLVIAGDFIDRGPESRKLVDLIINLKDKFPNTVVLKGNHEQMFLDWLDLETATGNHPFIWNGGRATLNGYTTNTSEEIRVPAKHLKFLRELPLTYETEDYFFCHAGVNPDNPLNEQTEEDLLWIRDEFLWSDKEFDKIVVHGHTPSPIGPWLERRRINLDGGGVFGNSFWIADLTNAEFHEIPGYVKPILPYSYE